VYELNPFEPDLKLVRHIEHTTAEGLGHVLSFFTYPTTEKSGALAALAFKVSWKVTPVGKVHDTPPLLSHWTVPEGTGKQRLFEGGGGPTSPAEA
jgi:hypothetical protein